jgi:hypothetical protein
MAFSRSQVIRGDRCAWHLDYRHGFPDRRRYTGALRRRTVEWQQRMRGTLQTDIPALNDTFYGQPMPFPEDSGGGAGNDSHDPPFGHENEMQEEASQGDRVGAANGIVVGDVWTPLAISGSSISSRENETSEKHIAEPLASQVNTSGSSSESRALGRSFQRQRTEIRTPLLAPCPSRQTT